MAYTKNLGRRHHLRLGGRDNFLDSGIYDIVYDNLGGLSLRIFKKVKNGADDAGNTY